MRPIALLLFAAVARLMWSVPAWWAIVPIGGAGAYVAIEAWRSRARMKAVCAQQEAEIEPWKPCGARRQFADGGFMVECVKQAGHDADHLADRSSIYWRGN